MDDMSPPAPRPRPRNRARVLVALAIISGTLAVVAFQMRDEAAPVDVIDLANLQAQGDAPTLTAAPRDDTEAAPDFSVDLLAGGVFTLSEHAADDGRPVFLNLWASWCLPCRAEMPAIDAAASRHPGIRFIGVAVQDDPTAATSFAQEVGVSYDLAIDTKEIVSDSYPSFGLPVSYLISGDGIILGKVIGEVDEARIASFIAAYVGG